MKVIFSRKGVDSAAGKCASPLIGERPVSIPIPTAQPTPTSYGDLSRNLSDLAADLSGGRLAADAPCHLDPDIDPNALDVRPPGWRGSLGQASSALSHLNNQAVGPGDLFLFWGLYRPAERTPLGWRYCGPRRHCIFGWLAIDDVRTVGANGDDILRDYPWLAQHPHVRDGWPRSNAVFVAKSHFELGGRVFPGSGVFQKAYTLTDMQSGLPSLWSVPAWLDPQSGGTGMTYHDQGRWQGAGRLRSAARGQEFVADIANRADAREWLASLLEAHR